MNSLNKTEQESVWAELVGGDGEADQAEPGQREEKEKRKTISRQEMERRNRIEKDESQGESE